MAIQNIADVPKRDWPLQDVAGTDRDFAGINLVCPAPDVYREKRLPESAPILRSIDMDHAACHPGCKLAELSKKPRQLASAKVRRGDANRLRKRPRCGSFVTCGVISVTVADHT